MVPWGMTISIINLDFKSAFLSIHVSLGISCFKIGGGSAHYFQAYGRVMLSTVLTTWRVIPGLVNG